MVLKYPAIIAIELKKIKTPVTIRNTPVITEISPIWRLTLAKCLRKVEIPMEVSMKGIARPKE
jgi:hypothetical protein